MNAAAGPYKSSVWARWTIRLICLHASDTASRVVSRDRIEGVFQHSTSRKRWRVRKSFFFIADDDEDEEDEEDGGDGGGGSFFCMEEEYNAHFGPPPLL